ncbi:MAG: transposase [bacterium]|nr:transposase [bacterium]
MWRVIALAFCCLFASASLANSVSRPLATEFTNVTYDQYPTPGVPEAIQFSIRANTDCTAAIRVVCGGNLALVTPQDSLSVVLMRAGESFSKMVNVVYTAGESARIFLEVRASNVSYGYKDYVSRWITIVPDYGHGDPAGAHVGVYFDPDATIACLPDSANFPLFTTAYVVLTDYQESAGPVAWEGQLAADPGVSLADAGLSGQGFSLAPFPKYRVGLAQPLGITSSIVLATIDVYATAPGGIYFKGLDDTNANSYPTFVVDGGISPIPMHYTNGGPQQIVASIGDVELQLTPIELLDRLAQLVTPPRLHKHRYCGVLAPNAALRAAVTASAGPAGATLQLLEQARASMGLPSASPPESDPPSPLSNLRRAAARCWALLLVRIYECLPLRCPKCGEPMRIIAFVLDRPTIERILAHIGEPTQPPAVLPARSPPQLAFGFDQTIATDDWPEMDQTAGQQAGGWE